MNSPDLLAYDTSSLASTTSSDSSDLFSSDSFLPMDNPSVDWNSYDLSSVPLDLGASPETFTSSDDTLWDDSSYSLPPDVIATGCSGTFGKREEGASCSTTREEDPCDPDKEAMCCTPSWMMRSRWAGGGFNMDGCVQRMGPFLSIRSAYVPKGIHFRETLPRVVKAYKISTDIST